MPYFYILYSNSFDKYYYGSTSSLEERVKKHNTNHSGFTGSVNDWRLVYQEEYETKELAFQREMQIKKWKNRKRVEALIGNSVGSEHPD